MSRPMDRPLIAIASLTLSALLAASAAQAVTPQQTYAADRKACLSGQSNQDRATCLKEAGAVLAESRAGRRDGAASPQDLSANALQRCERVQTEDREACRRMVQGEGQRSGSVDAGGVLTQIATPTPAQPASGPMSR